MQRIFEALSSPIRREVLWLTWNDELTVGQIADHFDVSAPTLSSHLATLPRCRAGGDAGRRQLSSLRHETTRPLKRSSRFSPSRTDGGPKPTPCLNASSPRCGGRSSSPSPSTSSSTRRAHSTPSSIPSGTAPRGSACPSASMAGTSRRRSNGAPRSAATTTSSPSRTSVAMTWDFDDEAVPVPGRQLIGYLRVHPNGRGSRIEVHQHAANDLQASFLTTAWSTVLGRFAAAHSTTRPNTTPALGDRSAPPDRNRSGSTPGKCRSAPPALTPDGVLASNEQRGYGTWDRHL